MKILFSPRFKNLPEKLLRTRHKFYFSIYLQDFSALACVSPIP